jgi:prepilin-type N-terminal cleavage/methylation domain-containing protein
MKLQTISSVKRGFTLIEILVVSGVLTLLFFAGSFLDIGSYGRGLISREEELLVSILSKARSRAMNNVYETEHGVHIDSDTYVLFRGSSYSALNSTNEPLEKNSNISIAGINDIVFKQLSGEAGTSGVITLSDNLGSRTITISKSGLIDW